MALVEAKAGRCKRWALGGYLPLARGSIDWEGFMRVLEQANFRPGDLPPEGYLAWHEWADVQRKAGIKQVACGRCGLWKCPQEFSKTVDRMEAQSRNGPVTLASPVCNTCNKKLNI